MTSTLPSRELLNELKLAKGKNSLVFAITEDREALNRLLTSNNFNVRSVDLRDNGNLLQMLGEWEHTPDNTVYLIYGISSQFPAVLGYLNLHRDLLNQIKRPVLMAVSEYEIREIQKHAPDLYRYRSRTYNLKANRDIGIKPIFSEPKPIYYKLPIIEEKINVDAIRERIKLDEYMLGTVNDDYKKAELYMDLAISYFKLDDFDMGDDFSRKSMELRKRLNDKIGVLINYRRLISVYYLKNQFRKIVELSSLLIKIDPTSALTYIFSGVAYGELGKLEIALECFDKAIGIDPQNAGIWSNKGVALAKLGRIEEAIEAYSKAIEIDPQNADAWYNKGVDLSYLGQTEKAIEAYSKATEIEQEFPQAYYNKGSDLFKLSRSEEALEAYEKAIEVFEKELEFDPKLAQAWCNKGIILSELGRTEEATDANEKAIELDPKLPQAWHNKGVYLDNSGRMEEAIEAYEKAVEIDPQNSAAYVSLARLYRKLGREAENAEACKAARDLIETESEYNRACFEAVCGSPDAALDLLRTALEKKLQTADFARQDPDIEFIRDDPRFAALLDEFSESEEGKKSRSEIRAARRSRAAKASQKLASRGAADDANEGDIAAAMARRNLRIEDNKN